MFDGQTISRSFPTVKRKFGKNPTYMRHAILLKNVLDLFFWARFNFSGQGRGSMAKITYFVVLAFEGSEKGRLIPCEPIAPQTAGAARRIAERLSHQKAGVVAFSRTGDPDLGDWAEAEVLAVYGEVPEELGLPTREVWELDSSWSEPVKAFGH